MSGILQDLPRALQITVWISIALVLALGILDLTGWIYGVNLFKSILPDWESMRIITALCFIFSALALSIIYIKRPLALTTIVPVITGIFLIIVSLLTVFSWLYAKAEGHEASITVLPVLNLFINYENRMALFSAFIFLLIGIILILLTSDKPALFEYCACFMFSGSNRGIHNTG